MHGPTIAGKFLSILSRLFTIYLQLRGFTCGIDDILIKKEQEKLRKQWLKEADQVNI